MTLAELAFACFCYARFTDYDRSYLRFLQATNRCPDLNSPEHRLELLIWLNQWNCRQFAHEYHEHASNEILFWYNKYNTTLFPMDRNLWELTESELSSAVEASYGALSGRTASYRTRNGNTFSVTVGPTGAAKILFAIRPNTLVPWDSPIRERLGYDGSSASYLAYLRNVKSILETLSTACQNNGFQLTDLPRIIGRPFSTVPKLIDEYYWVTITRGCSPPDSNTFRLWASWS